MAFADYAAYKAALERNSAFQGVLSKSASSVGVPGRLIDLFTAGRPAGAVPNSAVVPSRTVIGAFGQENGSTGALTVIGADVAFSSSSISGGLALIIDRLSHQDGLSGTVTTAQTTRLPTAALTRYTDGVGVMAALTIYAAVGVTATTVTASYTNQAGTAGQTTAAVAFGSPGFREAGRLVLLPLAAGDTGVRSVESVTLAGTTGTAGHFGVVLFKPLAMIPYMACVQSICNYVSGGLLGGLPEVLDDACLTPVLMATTSSSGTIIPMFAEC